MVLEILLCLVLFIVGIQLFRGQWLRLIAGYNTSSREKREQINGHNLGKLIGGLVLICSLTIVITLIKPEIANVFAVLIPLLVLFSLVFAHFSRWFKVQGQMGGSNFLYVFFKVINPEIMGLIYYVVSSVISDTCFLSVRYHHRFVTLISELWQIIYANSDSNY